jgi:hypothetical protein
MKPNGVMEYWSPGVLEAARLVSDLPNTPKLQYSHF